MTTDSPVPNLYPEMTAAWRRTVDAFVEAGSGSWQPWFDAFSVTEDAGIAALGRRSVELWQAQTAMTVNWLLEPWWLPDSQTQARLQTGYHRVLDAQQACATAFIDVLAGRQRDDAGADACTSDEPATGQATAAEPRAVPVPAAPAAPFDAVAAAGAIAREAAERASQVAFVIKGSIATGGEMIFHVPGQSSYERATADKEFASQTEAIAAGFRLSRAPGGPAIRGKINRDGERIYHLPGQANYDRLEPDALFESEEHAVAEGFRPALR